MNTMYPRPREDRLLEAPSSRNAQGLFLPSACIFVGNLNTNIPNEQLERDLKTLFSSLGPCYPKIKQDKKKGLPGAFVQFENVDHALAALELKNSKLHGRMLRIEPSKARCIAVLGLLSGVDIAQEDVNSVLINRGPIISLSMMRYYREDRTGSWVCRVEFAYVDDCRDAIKDLQRHERYYMTLLESDHTQPAPGSGFRPAYSRRPSSTPEHNGNGQPRGCSGRGRRQAQFSSRGWTRPAPIPYPAPFIPNAPSFNGLSGPPIGPTTFPYSNESHFPPPPLPLPYIQPHTPYPVMVPSDPGLGNPAQFAWRNGFYNPEPTWYGHYPPSIEMVDTPSTVYSQSSGYFGPPMVYIPVPGHSIPPEAVNTPSPMPVNINAPVEAKAGRNQSTECVAPATPETEIRADEEPESDAALISRLVDRTTPEKAPRLIDTNDSSSHGEGEDSPVANNRKSSFIVPSLEPVAELETDEQSDEDAQHTDNTVGSTLAFTSDSDGNENKDTTCPGMKDKVSSCSPSKPLPTVEEYVRREASRLNFGVGEGVLKEVIEELESEMSARNGRKEENGHRECESDGSSGSHSPSPSESASSDSD